MNRTRRAATVLHRWTGLGIAGFLTIVGLTGAVLAWNDELERVFAPSLFTLTPQQQAQPPLDPFALRDAAARAYPRYAINGVDLERRSDQPALFFVEARPGGPAPATDQIALDPATGRIIGERLAGAIGAGAINLMPFLDALHERLALGDWGAFALGVVALAWTFDCFVGLYLTLPARGEPRRNAPAWIARWRPAWLIRPGRGRFRLFYDLHRAGGLWPWLLMLLLAWSGVAFNLPQAYQPVTRFLLGMDSERPRDRVADPAIAPRLDWRAAHRLGRAEMAYWAGREGFAVRSERLMFYDPGSHAYEYRVTSDRDPGSLGNTSLRIDGDTGRVTSDSLPTGRSTGTTLTTWIEDIHAGVVFGLAMKIALSVTGVGIALLSITGVWLWWRKRSARRKAYLVCRDAQA